MFAWLMNFLFVYLLIFVWGYFSLKLFYGGELWSIIFALCLISAYYNFSRQVGFFSDVVYILGAVDYKVRLRERTGLYLQFAWDVGLSGVKKDIEDRIEIIRDKLDYNKTESIENDSQQNNSYTNHSYTNNSYTNSSFDQDWYDEQLQREREKARKAKEEAKRAKEEAEKAKRQNRQNQNNQQSSGSRTSLDPTKLRDAYAILGVPYGTDKATCKKHFRKLMSMYHPDKLADFTDYRRKQMEQEAKDIGVAWETICRMVK